MKWKNSLAFLKLVIVVIVIISVIVVIIIIIVLVIFLFFIFHNKGTSLIKTIINISEFMKNILIINYKIRNMWYNIWNVEENILEENVNVQQKNNENSKLKILIIWVIIIVIIVFAIKSAISIYSWQNFANG